LSVTWNAQPKQSLFLREVFNPDGADEILYGGAAGGGKTDSLLVAAIVVAEKFPGAHILFLRRTLDELQMKPIPRSKELIPLSLATYSEKWNRWHFKNGSVLQFTYLKKKGDETRFQSGEFPLIIFDELTGFEEYQYIYLLSRNRTSKAGIVPKIISGTNPGGVGHTWVRARFIDFAPPFKVKEAPQDEVLAREGLPPRKRLFIPAVLEDNQVLVNADPGYRARLLSMDEANRDALLYGNWDAFSGKVFKELDPAVHGEEPRKFPKRWPKIMSIDWGYAKPFSIYWAAIDPYNYGRVHVYREYYGVKRNHAGEILSNQGVELSASFVARRIKQIEEEAGEEVEFRVGSRDLFKKEGHTHTQYAGESKSLADTFAEHGVHITPANNDRIQGKNNIHEYLKYRPDGIPGVLINKYCQHFWRTIPGLPFSTSNPEDVDSQAHIEDHAYESFRYLLMAAPTIHGDEEEIIEEEFQTEMAIEEARSARNPITGY